MQRYEDVKMNVWSRFSWLAKYSRPIQISGDSVDVLYTPKDYFNALKVSPNVVI